MYEIRPESIKTFITDRNVRLPRFQRKQTWDEKKNFQLCISLFKEYPIGVCILSVEESKGKTIRWLLDGRQRKNALQMMYDDPENIYNWAKKFIGFKNSDQPSELEEKFYEKINEYIEADLDEELDTNQLDPDKEDESDSDNADVEGSINVNSYGLDFLLNIIKIIHNKNKKVTGFTRPFDFTKFVKKLSYVEHDENGGIKFSSRRVKTFIDEYRKFCDDEKIDHDLETSFYTFLDSRCDIMDKAKTKLAITERWEAIRERVLLVEKFDTLLTSSNSSKIGVIEVKNLTPSDSQKIFNIINSEGEKLTAVEILSAKPHWNVPVENPSDATITAIEKLYKRIGTIQTDVVRWDLPATLLKRIGKNFIFKQFSDEKKTDFEKELTIGFKILSGVYTCGITKDNIESIGKNASINWNTDVENLIYDFQQMLKLISSFEYFKYFKSWNTTMMELTSDSVALNFILVAYKDWIRKDKAIGDSTAKQFQKNCFILWDKLIFEYINRQWRGSSDSKIANNLTTLSTSPKLLSPILDLQWKELLEDQVFAENRIESSDISLDLMKPLLYHFYCLNSMQGHNTDYEIEVDHIIPQTLFNESSIPKKELVQNNLLNLGLLPKNENISKGNKKLIIIDSQWLKDQIVKYELISEEKFMDYSNVNNYSKMFDERAVYFLNTYTVKRNDLLNN